MFADLIRRIFLNRRPTPPIDAAELVDVLARIGRGEGDLAGVRDGGDLSYKVTVDGWRLSFFNDACEVDYLEWATAPDGRIGELDNWSEDCDRRYSRPDRIVLDPLGALPDDLRTALEKRVRDACEQPYDPIEWTRW